MRRESSGGKMHGTLAITRRDFIGGVLVGSGAALLGTPAPAHAQGLGPDWTGFGGVGDYAVSNGNTADVVNAAHGIRDGRYTANIPNAQEIDGHYDVVVVGSGFSGMTAAYEYFKARGRNGRCLVLDNHPVFGGEAKQNEFEVDGYHLYGPQGSNGTAVIDPPGPSAPAFWRAAYKYCSELNLPTSFKFTPPSGIPSDLKYARDNYELMFHEDDSASIGYFFEGDAHRKPVWVKDIWKNKLADTPLDPRARHDLLEWRYGRKDYLRGQDGAKWLDSMTYSQFVRDVMGLGPAVCRYIDPIIATGDYGLSSDVISAYAARLMGLPGVTRPETSESHAEGKIFAFPGGNTTMLRHFVKAVLPQAIGGRQSFADIATQPINFVALDQPGQSIRIRQGATVVSVRHEGAVESSRSVRVTYNQSGRLFSVRSSAVVLCIGAWVTRRIVADLPQNHQAALAQFHHGPILVVNVALRNWRFLARLGISAARWFEGLGFFANVRQPMILGNKVQPFDPDKPIVLTFYMAIAKPGLPIGQQAAQARMQLFTTSYGAYEQQLRMQMQHQFGSYGFDSQRDIAGIILNRWGHAYLAPQPGFYFGKEGAPGPMQVMRQPFGRISFGHSEISGTQNWPNATIEGARAIEQAMAVL